MKRLLPATLIALVCHGLVFFFQPINTATPPRLKAAQRPVHINLAHFVPTAPKVPEKTQPPEAAQTEATPAEAPPAPPAPKKMQKQPPQPRPKPPPRPRPQVKKQAPKPKEPQPVSPAPVPAATPAAVETVAKEAPPPTESTRAAAAVGVDPGPPQLAPLVEATPLYADNPPPRYPRSARRRGHQGTVLLAVHVMPSGHVDDLKVETTSGFKVLDKAALEAVRTWRFESGRRGKTKVAMWVEVPIRFELN